MKLLINIIIWALCMALAAHGEGSKGIQEFPLDDHQVYAIAVSTERVTTISFPGPISAIEAAQVTVDGRTPGLFQIAHTRGSFFLSVRALAKKSTTNINIRWNEKTYVLQLFESDKPFYSVIFDYSTSDTAANKGPMHATPHRLLALLDKAKAFPVLAKYHPDALAAIEYTNYAPKPPVMDYRAYAVQIEEAFRFNLEDTLIFRVTLINKTDQPIQYRPDGFALKVGERLYPQSIGDASGIIPPKSQMPAYFAITGTPDGGRNDISLKNNFIVILDAAPAVATNNSKP
jgi:hypothetical protein